MVGFMLYELYLNKQQQFLKAVEEELNDWARSLTLHDSPRLLSSVLHRTFARMFPLPGGLFP
jgi:hypothetical protein